jgi:hypothetical protein
MWKNLGKRRGQSVCIAKFYAQKSWSCARKMLVASHDSAIIRHGSRERRPLQSGVGDPSGGGFSATEAERSSVRPAQAGSPGDAAGASQRRLRRGGRTRAPPRPLGDLGRLPRRSLNARPAARSSERRRGDGGGSTARECTPAAPVTGPAPGRAAFRPDAAHDGAAHRSRRRGSRQRLLREASAALARALLTPLAFRSLS